MITLIEAPSNLGLRPPAPGREPGVRHMPDALRRAGLATKLGVNGIQRVEAPPYHPQRETPSRIRNAAAIRAYSLKLAPVIEQTLQRGRFPLVIGGDCSIMIGSALALRRVGNYGLCFIDGHPDLLTPQSSQTGGAAGMDLALVTGYGPDILTAFDEQRPLMPISNVAVVACRDCYVPDELADSGSQIFPLDELRAKGIPAIVQQVETITSALDGIWIHLDVDVLDSDLMPAVDSPQPDGLNYDELSSLLRTLIATQRIAGMQVTIFDPDLDPDGQYAERLVEVIVAGLTGLS